MALDNIKISDLPTAESITSDSLMELALKAPIESEVPYLSRKVSISDLAAIFGSGEEPLGAAQHNAIYRGKCLGTAPTQLQLQAIYNGSFRYIDPETGNYEHIYIGDFWSNDPDDPSEIRWRVAGLNYYYNTGTRETHQSGKAANVFTTNHAVIIPDTPIVSSVNSYDSSSNAKWKTHGGYQYSYFKGYKSNRETFTVDTDGTTKTFTLAHAPAWASAYTTHVYSNYFGSGKNLTVKYMNTISISGSNVTLGVGTGTSARIVELGVPSGQSFSLDTVLRDLAYSGTNQLKLFANDTVQINYQYYDSTYDYLGQAETIINNVFGSEHIVRHEFIAPVESEVYPCTFRGGNDSKFDSKIELPTIKMILGTDKFNDFSYKQYVYPHLFPYTHYNMWSDPKKGADFYVSTETDADGPSIQNHYEEHQLPLFMYDPSLIHPRAAYWFRDYSMVNPVINFKGVKLDNEGVAYYVRELTEIDPMMHIQYAQMSGTGVLIRTAAVGGIRPVFCISNTDNPHSPYTGS